MSIPVKIVVIDDEWESPIVAAVLRRLNAEEWQVTVVNPGPGPNTGADFEDAAVFELEESLPDAVLLDVRFGDHQDDRFKGLGILKTIISAYPNLPVLMFTQYTQGPERDAAMAGTLKWDAKVDFVDKLASPDEVVLRLRRLVGGTPETIAISPQITLDTRASVVTVTTGEGSHFVPEIQGMKYEILQELASTWYRSPGELVPFGKLERLFEGEDARASLRVRIREIKDALGNALGIRFGPSDLIINVRDQGYRLVGPKA